MIGALIGLQFRARVGENTRRRRTTLTQVSAAEREGLTADADESVDGVVDADAAFDRFDAGGGWQRE